MRLPRLSLRLYFFALSALCAGELCFGVFYLQMRLELEPCPMCIMQRYALAGVCLVALAGAFHNRLAWLYGGLVTLIALAGGGSPSGKAGYSSIRRRQWNAAPGLNF